MMAINFGDNDLLQFQEKGISLEEVKAQLERYHEGPKYIELLKPAIPGDGILVLEEEGKAKYLSIYKQKIDLCDAIKFVPASGAASRMFRFLHEFLKTYDVAKETINAYINKNKASDLRIFLVGMEKLPFYDLAVSLLIDEPIDKEGYETDSFRLRFIHAIIDADKLNFADTPKAIIPFHKYSEHLSTPLEEQMFEAIHYMPESKPVKLHFTISPIHKHLFQDKILQVQPRIEDLTLRQFDVSYSFQSESTDTIAVDIDNHPLRNEEDKLIFRPGGHGSLLQNLNALNADLAFIKNIDNVVMNHFEEHVAKYKRVLCGLLLDVQAQSFRFLEEMDKNKSNIVLSEIESFIKDELRIPISSDYQNWGQQERLFYLKKLLDRPIRICGMVRNEGEPGGGPFWVRDGKGQCSLQIVESAQVNRKDPSQWKIWEQSTHFNPVDMVCSLRNYKGEKFDLTEFIDADAYFIASKTKVGKKLKALERPGLWNGAMAYWISIFVEVPIYTFNPVKTVNDLLKPAHQKK